MSVKEKQDNEEFKVISMDQEVIKGDANKLKLLITSYAAIMEVQDAYMQEEIKTKEKEAERIEAQIASGNLTEAGVENKKEELAALTDQIRSLKEVYDKFSESRTRFMDLAKKALRLPSANFEQLAAKGYTMISGEKIELSSLASSYETAQKTLTDEENVDVFSNINNEDIKKEIERVINEEVYTDDNTGKEKPVKDYNINEVDADSFDKNTLELANFVKSNIDDKNNKELNEAGSEIFEEALKAAKANDDTKDKKTAEEAQNDHEDEQEYDEELDNKTKIIPIDIPFGDSAEYEGDWAESDMTKDNQEQEASNRHYTTLRQTDQNNKKTVDFNGDTVFQQFLASRQEGLNEKSSAISSLRTEVDTLEQTAKDKKERLAEATRKSEQDAADMEIMAKQLEELKRLDEEENKLSSEETTLNDRKSELNSEISGYDERIDEIEKQNAANLEKYKAMQEEINKYIKGKTPNDGQYGGAGGRRK